MKKITINLAKIKDIGHILQVRKITWLSTYPNKKYKISKALLLKMDFISPERFKAQRQRLFNKDGKVWVAKIGKKLIGYGAAQKYKGKKPNYIHSLYILPNCQRHGVGKKMMQKILPWLGEQKPILLQVAKYNTKAINFYKKFGFKITKPTKNVPTLPDGRKIPSVEMERS